MADADCRTADVVGLANRVVRLLYPYGSERRVLRGPARGMRFIVEPGIGFNYAVGSDAAAPRFFERHVRAGMTVVDVGANRGQMALLFAALVGPTGRVVAFEPAPAVFASLARNVRLNLLERVQAIQAAVSDRETTLTFTYAPGYSTQGKLRDVEPSYPDLGTETFPVSAVSLDTTIDRAVRPNVMKIDVEGGAAGVLRGARRILDEAGPGVYIELHGPEEQAAVRDELLPRGYVIETPDGVAVPDPTVGGQSPLWCYKPLAA